jgi:hypothetical protein
MLGPATGDKLAGTLFQPVVGTPDDKIGARSASSVSQRKQLIAARDDLSQLTETSLELLVGRSLSRCVVIDNQRLAPQDVRRKIGEEDVFWAFGGRLSDRALKTIVRIKENHLSIPSRRQTACEPITPFVRAARRARALKAQDFIEEARSKRQQSARFNRPSCSLLRSYNRAEAFIDIRLTLSQMSLPGCWLQVVGVTSIVVV